MQSETNQIRSNESTEEVFSLQILLQGWRDDLLFALSYKKIIAFFILAGTLSGIGYAWIKHTTYSARLTFVVEEAKSGGGSIASALAGQFGFDMSSLSGTSGILAGDNVLELLKSRSLLKKTLLTPYSENTKSSIADEYATVYGWKEKWKEDSKINKLVNFPPNQEKFSRLEDSLLQVIIKRIVEKELSIAKPDKKLGFFELQITNRGEILSKLLCERLLKITTDFYVETKTKRLTNNVMRLQRRSDSLGILLDKKTHTSAETNQFLLDANPAYADPMVNAEISSRNKYIQGTIYAEIIKNLEASKTALIQETPTVQIVDSPELPLTENKTKWYWAGLAGGVIGLLVSLLLIILGKKKKLKEL